MGLFSSIKRAARRPSSKLKPSGPGTAASIEPLTQDTITFDDFKAEVAACGLDADYMAVSASLKEVRIACSRLLSHASEFVFAVAQLEIWGNDLSKEGEKALKKAVRGKKGFELMLTYRP